MAVPTTSRTAATRRATCPRASAPALSFRQRKPASTRRRACAATASGSAIPRSALTHTASDGGDWRKPGAVPGRSPWAARLPVDPCTSQAASERPSAWARTSAAADARAERIGWASDGSRDPDLATRATRPSTHLARDAPSTGTLAGRPTASSASSWVSRRASERTSTSVAAASAASSSASSARPSRPPSVRRRRMPRRTDAQSAVAVTRLVRRGTWRRSRRIPATRIRSVPAAPGRAPAGPRRRATGAPCAPERHSAASGHRLPGRPSAAAAQEGRRAGPAARLA